MSPILSREQARELVLSRLLEEPPTTLPAFGRAMYENGVTPRVLSRLTLRAYLDGKVYPDLTDREGIPIDWSRVPKSHGGRPGGFKAANPTARRLDAIEESLRRIEHRLDRVLNTTSSAE